MKSGSFVASLFPHSARLHAGYKSALLVEHIGILREAVLRTRLDKPFTLDAWVVLPEHLHAVWTLPPGVSD